MDKLKPPKSFSFVGNVYEVWKLWLKYFDCYLTVTENDEKHGQVKTSVLLTFIRQRNLVR